MEKPILKISDLMFLWRWKGVLLSWSDSL